MVAKMDRADVGAVGEQGLLARIAAIEAELPKCLEEKIETAIVDAAKNRGHARPGRRRERDIERVRLMTLHGLREQLFQAGARLVDAAHFVERGAVDLFPAPKRGVDELWQSGEVP